MLVRGLLYLSIIPPWQAPDEPQHYQMIRLFMQLGRVPSREDVQKAVNLHSMMEQSLQENNFWEQRFHRPAPDFQEASSAYDVLKKNNLTAAVGHPPLYYILASSLLWLFRRKFRVDPVVCPQGALHSPEPGCGLGGIQGRRLVVSPGPDPSLGRRVFHRVPADAQFHVSSPQQ